MGLADTVTKAYMKENTVFADAFNYLIYGGKAVVDPAQLQELDTTEIALPFGTQEESGNQTDDVAQKYRDVLKSAVIKQRSGLHPFGHRKPNEYPLCNAGTQHYL